LLVLWELVPRLGLIPELFLPSMSKTLSVLWQDARIYGHAVLITLMEVALAMVIACGGGKNGAPSGGTYVAFALPDAAPPAGAGAAQGR
jgi:ABC-type nitrate/sulfonate/bicarbonate transport system permease component